MQRNRWIQHKFIGNWNQFNGFHSFQQLSRITVRSQKLEAEQFFTFLSYEKILVLCEKLLTKFSSNFYVLRPPETEKTVFTNVKFAQIICLNKVYKFCLRLYAKSFALIKSTIVFPYWDIRNKINYFNHVIY